MKANTYCGKARLYLTVFLNGKKVADAVEADEEAGYVWAVYRGADGKVAPAIDAKVGALIHEDVQVIKLTGEVEIKISVKEGDELIEQQVREECKRHFHPIQVLKIIQ